MKVLINATYYDFKTYKENCYIIFDETIIEVGDMQYYRNREIEEIDVSNKLIMPGLVNAHTHIYSTFARGLSVEYSPTNFLEILEQLWWKLDYHITNEVTYYSALVSGVEYIKNGVTTVIDHHASKEVLGSLQALKKGLTDETKVRGIFCFETSDRFNVKDAITENVNMFKHRTNNVSALFGVHAMFTISDSTLRDISKQKLPLHIHVDESSYDREYCLHNYLLSPIKRLDEYHLLNEQCLLAHCAHVDEEDLEIIKRTKSKVVFNVTSNMNNAVGLPNYSQFKQRGIDCLIGNDGISHSMAFEYLNMFFTMHHKEQSVTSFGYDDLLKMINNSYEYASSLLDTKLGKIEIGYAADLCVFDYQPFTEINRDNVLSHLLFGLFHNYKPIDVYIGGKLVLDNNDMEPELLEKYNKAKEVSRKLWQDIKKGAAYEFKNKF